MRHAYGWIPDKPDKRDVGFVAKVVNLPASVDLRAHMSPIYDQGSLGSCTANAVAAALDYQRTRQDEPLITPSRLFIYYNERKDDKQIKEDAGATIRESVKAVKKYGACPETEWPYDISKFTAKPTKQVYKDATRFEDLTYERVSQSLADIKGCLATARPVVIGISVYESFESEEVAKTGIVPMPSPSEELLGGHAVLVVGYEHNRFIVRNSWGTSWGDRGYFYLPEEYLSDPKLSSDFWTLLKVK